jgi:hypothetical protein
LVSNFQNRIELCIAARPAGGWSAEFAAEALAVALEQRGLAKSPLSAWLRINGELGRP